MIKRLENKIALVTGAVRGIGRATAELFANENAIVIFSDINDSLGSSFVKSIVYKSIEYKHLDVSNEDNWIEFYKYIKAKFGKLDILV
ncbi:MAG: SDR family NAD(P)-dependent oxidoreductase [Francisella endosymbiont of Hyalomma scupense]